MYVYAYISVRDRCFGRLIIHRFHSLSAQDCNHFASSNPFPQLCCCDAQRCFPGCRPARRPLAPMPRKCKCVECAVIIILHVLPHGRYCLQNPRNYSDSNASFTGGGRTRIRPEIRIWIRPRTESRSHNSVPGRSRIRVCFPCPKRLRSRTETDPSSISVPGMTPS